MNPEIIRFFDKIMTVFDEYIPHKHSKNYYNDTVNIQRYNIHFDKNIWVRITLSYTFEYDYIDWFSIICEGGYFVNGAFYPFQVCMNDSGIEADTISISEITYDMILNKLDCNLEELMSDIRQNVDRFMDYVEDYSLHSDCLQYQLIQQGS